MDRNEKFDYYNNSFSYVKIIMKNLNNSLEECVVREIFNEMVSDMDSNDIYEMLIISSLFEKKLNSLSETQKNKLLNDIYTCYIKPMIINYAHDEMDLVKLFFNSLKNKVLSMSGFYGLFGDNQEVFHENIGKFR